MLWRASLFGDKIKWGREMLQKGDKTILLNVAKVIAVLIVIMFSLIIVASYIGSSVNY